MANRKTPVFDLDLIPRKHRHLIDSANMGGDEYGETDLVGLQDQITFKVNCCKSRHTITYTHKGELILHDHTEEDLEQLAALRHLGAGVSRCLEVAEDLEKALTHIKGFRQTHNKNYEASYRKLPKPIFHYRRSRAEYIRYFRGMYDHYMDGASRNLVGMWEYPMSKPRRRLTAWYIKMWREVTSSGRCNFLFVKSHQGVPYTSPWTGPWADRWGWYKRVYSRGLCSAVYDDARDINCYIVDSDPDYHVGDKKLRVMVLHSHRSPHGFTERVCWGTAHLEKKWHVVLDPEVMSNPRFVKKAYDGRVIWPEGGE